MSNETLNFEVEQAKKVAKVKELFLDSYIEARTIDLMQEFMSIKSSDSTNIFRIKYQIDALMHLKSTLETIIQIGNNAIATAEGVNNG